MKKRDGASLLNVMVFMLFAVMITAQVFFFAKWSADSVAEEREIMMYRLNLDSLVEVAKDALKVKDTDDEIVHDIRLSISSSDSMSSGTEGSTSDSAERKKCIDAIGLVRKNLSKKLIKSILSSFSISNTISSGVILNSIQQGLRNAADILNADIAFYGIIGGIKYVIVGGIDVMLWRSKDTITKSELENLLKDTLTIDLPGMSITFDGRDTVIERIIKLVFHELNFETGESLTVFPKNKLNFRQFYDGKYIEGKLAGEDLTGWIYTEVKDLESHPYYLEIRDLDYRFDDTFDSSSRDVWINGYGNNNADKKVFAAMPHDDKGEYFLIRAWAELPDNYFGRKLMYQVLVRREEPADVTATAYTVTTLSFQEVWF